MESMNNLLQKANNTNDIEAQNKKYLFETPHKRSETVVQ